MCLDLLDSIRSFIEGHNFRVYKMIQKWIINTFEESSGKNVFRYYKHSIKRT